MPSFNTTKPLSLLGGFLALFTLFLGACGPDGGETGSGQPTQADGGAGSPTTTSQVLGTWQYVSGTMTLTCSDGSSQSAEASGGTMDFTAGSGPARVVRVDDHHCSLGCSVAGDTVTCDPGPCASDGLTATTKSDVFTLANGRLQETSTIELAEGNGATCETVLTAGVLAPAPPGQ